ncbi:MAG: SxtJ family membrane protein [Motiliproteus sp.]|nr:SxtJ family membrane protein [Motiliproteus sp.]MCW9051892.1 SxtJ family membrane protein [Motiliproteus sp.]
MNNPSLKQLKLFGLLLSGVLLFWISFALYQWQIFNLYAITAYLLALLPGAIALWAPKRLSGFFQRWTGVAHGINRILIKSMLVIIFYLVISPIGVLKRFLGSDEIRNTLVKERIGSGYRIKCPPSSARDMEEPY